jgi:hypothetical protein
MPVRFSEGPVGAEDSEEKPDPFALLELIPKTADGKPDIVAINGLLPKKIDGAINWELILKPLMSKLPKSLIKPTDEQKGGIAKRQGSDDSGNDNDKSNSDYDPATVDSSIYTQFGGSQPYVLFSKVTC